MNKIKISAYMMEMSCRLLLALGGGYLLSRLFGAALARTLTLPDLEATAVAVMSAYILFIMAGIWAFLAATARQAGLGLGLALAAGFIWLALVERGGAV